MALILEIEHPNGTRSWQRLDALPLTLGRSLGNDLILDDPYVDAKHARIAMDGAGALRIEELGTVNGLVANETRIRGAVDVLPGVEVRVGRTKLRFRDTDEVMAPALIDEPVVEPRAVLARPARPPVIESPSPAGRLGVWINTTPARIAVIVTALGIFALGSWLSSSDRSSMSTAMSGAAGFAVLAALWAGVWAVASRASVHRFHYLGHFAIISAIAVVGLLWSTAESWLAFFFPDAGFIEFLSTVSAIALMTALIASHLALSSTMSRVRRWRVGVLISCGIMALGGLAILAMDDSFSDVATFSGTLKPVAASWIPTRSVDEFGAAMREVKDDVDELAAKKEEE